MKFQCDRCKTRYSIADERVRGKILKIRCKNCEAVITVREGMDGASARRKVAKKPAAAKAAVLDSKPVLRDAFERVMDSNQDELTDSDRTKISAGPPPQLEEEWYVSLDGEQFGPFNLQQATDWVAVRSESDELFCWSEGFGDWLPIDKVSHFRRRRGEPKPTTPLPRPASQAPPIPMAVAGAPSSGSVVPAAEATPKPLFAATLEKIEREENPSLDPLANERHGGTNGRSQSTGNDATDEAGELEFEIGEASRVVNLPMLARELPPNSANPAPNHLPGVKTSASNAAIGVGTGGFATVGKVSGGQAVVVPISQEMPSQPHEVLAPSRRRGWIGRHLPLVIGLGALCVVVVIMGTIALSEEDGGGGRVNRARASVDGLGESLDPRTIKIIETKEVPGKSGGKRRGGGTRRGGGNVAANGTRNGTSRFGKRDDIDLSGANNRPLDGDDLMSVYRDNRLGVKLCYERALKKDPLLDVRKVYVNLTVATSGVVTKVQLSSHRNSQLGTCLVQRMRRWRFRRSSETFSGRFPLVFRN